MKLIETALHDVLIIEPAVFGDDRDYGYKEITLQFVLAIVAVGALAFMSMRKAATPAG